MALDHTIQAGIEYDLRHYRRWKARQQQVEEEMRELQILPARPAATLPPPKGQPASNPTWRYVQRLNDLQDEYEWLECRIRRVERALAAMTDEQRKLVTLYYFEGVPREVVQRELGLSRAGFYRVRAAALECYAFVARLVPNRGREPA